MLRATLHLAFPMVALLAVAAPARSATAVIVSPLMSRPVPARALFLPAGKAVSVLVVDARADKSFVADASLAPGGDDPGIAKGYATPSENDLASFVGEAAKEALPVLGFESGSDLALTITIHDLRVEIRSNGDEPPQCTAYGIVGTSLQDSGGEAKSRVMMHVVLSESAEVGAGLKDVTAGALSRIYAHLAWQAVATALLGAETPRADAAAIEAFAASLSHDDAETAREGIFWLGIAMQPLPAVRDTLLGFFSARGGRTVARAAAESIGRLGIDVAKSRIEGILSGAERVGDWDRENEQDVWALMRSLADLGVKDLASKLPASMSPTPAAIRNLLAFENAARPRVHAVPAAQISFQRN